MRIVQELERIGRGDGEEGILPTHSMKITLKDSHKYRTLTDAHSPMFEEALKEEPETSKVPDRIPSVRITNLSLSHSSRRAVSDSHSERFQVALREVKAEEILVEHSPETPTASGSGQGPTEM